MERKEIRFAGSGGQGLILGAHILFRALGLEGRRAAQSQSYEPTSRGGFCYSDVIVSEDQSDYPLVTGLDAIVGLSQVGVDRSLPLLKRGALVVVDERLAPKRAARRFQAARAADKPEGDRARQSADRQYHRPRGAGAACRTVRTGDARTSGAPGNAEKVRRPEFGRRSGRIYSGRRRAADASLNRRSRRAHDVPLSRSALSVTRRASGAAARMSGRRQRRVHPHTFGRARQ